MLEQVGTLLIGLVLACGLGLIVIGAIACVWNIEHPDWPEFFEELRTDEG